MEDNLNINDVIKRQDDKEADVFRLQRTYFEWDAKQTAYFKELNNKSGDVIAPFTPRGNSRTETTVAMCNYYKNHPDEFRKAVAKLKTIPGFEKGFDFQGLYDAKYRYFQAALEYLETVDQDREKLFQGGYGKKIDDLAARNWFLYFQKTPDFAIFLCDDPDKNAKIIYDEFSKDYFGPLGVMLSNLINPEKFDGAISKNKSKNLQEAFLCLSNEAYSSCARDLFALIEHEHRRCSNLFSDSYTIQPTTGFQRADAIMKQIESLPNGYIKKSWAEINRFYRFLNEPSMGHIGTALNRNELIHGFFEREVTPQDCLQLFLLLLSMTDLAYRLSLLDDIKNSLIQDSSIMTC
jgi:hypothetical protein